MTKNHISETIIILSIALIFLTGCVQSEPLINEIQPIPQIVLDRYDQFSKNEKGPYISTCETEYGTVYTINEGSGDFYTFYAYDARGNLLETHPYSPYYTGGVELPRNVTGYFNCTFNKRVK